jgi:hypothetical protein
LDCGDVGKKRGEAPKVALQELQRRLIVEEEMKCARRAGYQTDWT